MRTTRCAANTAFRASARDTMGPWSNLGKAHQAGIAVGSDVDLMGEAWWSPGLTHPDGRSAFALWFTGGIFVDQDGKRFVNESRALRPAGSRGHRRAGDGVDDAAVLDDLRRQSTARCLRSRRRTFRSSTTEKYVDAGAVAHRRHPRRARRQIGVPAESLERDRRAVQRTRRQAVSTRISAAATKPTTAPSPAAARRWSRSRRARSTLPQFGISDLGTKGGLRTDTVGRGCSTPTGTPIAGLYAAGNTMAAPSGTVYPGGGNPIGTSALFAHLAVKDAATR